MNMTPPLPTTTAPFIALRGCSSREVTTVVLPHMRPGQKLKAIVKRNLR
jgi:hypothetical protein